MCSSNKSATRLTVLRLWLCFLVGAAGAFAQDQPFTLQERDSLPEITSASGKLALRFGHRKSGLEALYLVDKNTGQETAIASPSVRGLTGRGCFSEDDQYLAFSFGGASMGVVTVIMKRGKNGEFMQVKVPHPHEAAIDGPASVTGEDCWELAIKQGRFAKGSRPTHLYVHPVRWEKDVLQVQLRGDYFPKGGPQQGFEPLLFLFSTATKKLTGPLPSPMNLSTPPAHAD